jgi:hypothetical protein
MDPSPIIFGLLIVVLLHILIGFTIALVMDVIYNISENKAISIVFFWPLIILFFIFVYITKFLGIAFMILFTVPCKKIKQFIKLKETNMIEEDKRKKELVNIVLKELKLR